MKLNRFGSYQELIEATAKLLIAHLRSDVLSAVMLSGGKTPIPVYDEVASSWEPIFAVSDLRSHASTTPGMSQKSYILLSDERMVPTDSPESNYGKMAPMLEAIGHPRERVMKVDTRLPAIEAAKNYDAAIEKFLTRGGRVALGLLGLGADGHTASLFSVYDIGRGRGHWAIPITRPEETERVSVTADFLFQVRRIIFLATGPGKAAAIERFMAEDEELPAVAAVAGHRSVELWTA
jgi:6-phosphogluconolactonase